MSGYHFVPNVRCENQIIGPDSYNAIVNGLSAGISIIDRDMRIAWVNRRMAQSFGSAKNILGTHCYITYNHKKNICPNCPTLKTFKTGKVAEGIQIGFTKTGDKKYYYLNTAPIKDRSGRVIQVLELVQDITERKTIEEKLSHSYEEAASQLRTANIELKSMMELNQAMISTLNLQRVLSLIVKNASLIMRSEACSVRLLNKAGDALISGMTFGLDLDYLYKTPLKVGEGVAGLIALTKKPIAVTNIARDKRIKHVNYMLQEGLRSVLGVPILFDNQLLGVLMAYSRQERRFSEQEIGLFSTFASQAAIAMNNAKMHESLHRNYIDTIKSLVLAMESRYPYMKGHSSRVTRYAVRIARQMNLPEADTEMIHYTGYIHDVGKIAIPDAILNKPAKLTPSERAIVELHPIKGQEMLLPLKFLDKGIPAVRHHHERYDGNGYPDGLEKKKIPLGARILGTADAFDAMTSERPYRPKLQLREAIKELEVNSGSQFDPEIVSVFVKVLKK